MLKGIKIIAKILAISLVCFSLFLIVSGRSYLFKGIWNTYLHGHTTASATEYQIFEYRTIKSTDPKPWIKSSGYNTKAISAATLKRFSEIKTHAFVIIKNDSLMHEQYWDGFSDTSHTNSFSISKSYVAALLSCAIKDGYIKSMDELVSNYIPEFKNDARKNITLRHLATMTTGIDFDENYTNPFSFPAEGYYGPDLLLACAKYKTLKTEPGKVFKYLSGNSGLLGYCITKAVGKPISYYLSEKLWSPLNCEHEARWSLDKKDGLEKMFCCINSNATDFARMGNLYLHYGNWHGKQLIDSAFIVASITPYDCKETDGTKNDSYGYSIWLTTHRGLKVFYMQGLLSQYVICVPEKKLVICHLGRKKEPKGNGQCPVDAAMCIDEALSLYYK